MAAFVFSLSKGSSIPLGTIVGEAVLHAGLEDVTLNSAGATSSFKLYAETTVNAPASEDAVVVTDAGQLGFQAAGEERVRLLTEQWTQPLSKDLRFTLKSDGQIFAYEVFGAAPYGLLRWSSDTGALPPSLDNLTEILPPAADAFNPLQVEALVSQAATLLDRCMASRLAYQAVIRDWSSAEREIAEASNRVLELEHSLTPDVSKRPLKEKSVTADHLRQLASAERKYVALAATLTGSNEKPDPAGLPWTNVRYREALATAMDENALRHDALGAEIAQQNSDAGRESLSRAKHLHDNLVNRHAQLVKHASLSSSILAHLVQDLYDARLRIASASQGLSAITTESWSHELTDSAPCPCFVGLDQARAFVRNAGRFLDSLSSEETVRYATVRLPSSVGNSLDANPGLWQSVPLLLADNPWPDLRLIRLRGVGVESSGLTDSTVVRALVTLPREVTRVGRNGTATQRQTPHCLELRRVVDAASPRAPVMVLGPAHNASPFGKWELALQLEHGTVVGAEFCLVLCVAGVQRKAQTP